MPFVYALNHPIVSQALTHFTGRARQPATPPAFARLHQILWSQQILGAAPYNATAPAVSFTESRIEDLEWLLTNACFEPWGIVSYRDDVFAAGGAPVWSVRTEVLAQVPAPLRVWTARLAPGESEWLHEREWRIPAAQVSVGSGLRLAAIIVGDPNWRPATNTQAINPHTGQVSYLDQVPPITAGVQRWWWDASQRRLLLLPSWEDEYRDI